MDLERCSMDEFFKGREHMKEDACVKDLMKIFQARLCVADNHRKKFVELEDLVIETCFNSQKFCPGGYDLEVVVTRLLNWTEANA
jgi:hypothetical protein